MVGSHDGAYAFTVGQRRGLALSRPASDGRPRYVLGVDPVSSTVSVGPASGLDVGWLEATGEHVRRPAGAVLGAGQGPWHAGVRPQARRDGDLLRVEFDEPLRAVARGQAVCSTRPIQPAIACSAAAGSRDRHRLNVLARPGASRTVVAVADRVYPPVLGFAKTWFRAADLKFTVEGGENVPLTGGCVLVSTHVSYLDFIFVGLGAQPSKRLVRFMAKKAVFDHKISGPLMRGMHHIPVDRKAGAGAYDEALAALRAGEVVGVFPEATISQSFEVKQLKTGAARMALAAGVPIVPVTIWGSQRMWTKGHKRRLMRRHTPDHDRGRAAVEAAPGDKPVEVTRRIAEALETLLHKAQESYPDQPSGPDDTWWLPVRLGGTAPTLEQARELDAKQGHLG